MALSLLLTTSCFAGSLPNGWAVHSTAQKVFIKNQGQYVTIPEVKNEKILFAIEEGPKRIFFTPTGIVYRFDNWKKKYTEEQLEEHEREEARERKEKARKGEKISEEEAIREHKEEEERERAIKHDVDMVYMRWEQANPNVEVVTEEEATFTFSYGIGNGSIEGVKAYKKITYKNLYPGIDVQYVFHPDNGFEYSFILQPGADISAVKMVYSDVKKLKLDRSNTLHIPSRHGDITEQKPVAFYAGNSNNTIGSRFQLIGNTVSFQLDGYDKTQTVVIDPWVQTPNFNTQWDCVWECEKDAAGNVYLIGGVMPMVLQKYNSAGALQWSYNTPYDTTSWLGTFATDDAGNSYVTQGSTAAIQRISTAGTLVWNNGNPGGIFASTEFWNISFNCDQTRLIIGGTGNTLPPLPYIYQVNMANGNVTNSLRVTGGALFPTQEVRSITASGNGKYYFLTHDSIGYINQNFTACATPSSAIRYSNNGYGLGYKCENWRVNNTGIMALRTFGAFAFVHRGNRLDKRDFGTSALLSSATIAGGGFASSQVQNSGMDIDVCGNIYVGSKNQVIKYDQNLTQLATYPTTFNVYDVHVSTNGDIIACGSSGTSSSGARTGTLQLINAGACATIAIVCCDASICQAGPFCSNAAPVTLVSSTPGGVWSGPGITNTSTGVFNPSVAGPGTHTIVYTLACGSDSIRILVSPCGSLSVCVETNGTLTVSGGVAPYTWQKDTIVQNCSACFIGCAFPAGCATTQNAWTTFATGTNVNAPTVFPIRVTDAFGTTVTFANLAAIPPCTTCPTITVTVSAQTNVTCPSTNGSATVSPTGGTGPYTYTWSPNVSTTASATNLTAGPYNVTARDANGCTGTVTITIIGPVQVVATATPTATTCGLNNGSVTANATAGTAPFTYLWSNGATTQTISSVAAATYTVTITGTGGCTASASATVATSTGVTATATPTATTCGLNNGSVTANATAGTAPFTYAWSNGATTQTISSVASGSYTVTITGTGGCTASASATVATSTGVTATTTPTATTCGLDNGSVTANATAGTAPFTYAWSNGATTQTISGVAAASYTVTITGTGGCTASASATVATSTGVVINTSSTTTTCGNNNGTATVTVTSGTGPFTYLWSNAGTTATISNLAAATYTVTVTGAASCTATASVTVSNANSTLAVNFSNQTNPTCAGNDGSITATLSGGTAPYQITIDTGGTPITLNSPIAGSQNIPNLGAGTVTVSVTDGQGCTASATATLIAPTNCCQFIMEPVITQPTCGQSNGSVTMNITNGSGNYTFNWSNGSTSNTASNLGTGVLTVTVTDNGQACTQDTSLTINSNSTLTVAFSSQVNPTCAGNDGSITVTLAGGTAPYQITIDTGGTPITLTSPIAGSQNIPNLGAGTVNVSVTDGQGCDASATATLIAPTNCCQFTVSAAVIQPTCGQADGSITLTTQNGSGNYTYNWANGNITNAITSVGVGTYFVTITDLGFAGCSIDTTFSLSNSNGPTVNNVTVVNETCPASGDGTATVTASGGTGTLTIVWSNTQTNFAATNLTAGTYTFTVTDAANCQASGSATVGSGVCCNLQISATATNGTCGLNNASITVTINTAGTAPYQYSLNGGTQQTSPTFANLAAGTYSVVVTDAVGCSATASATVSPSSNSLAVTINATNSTCFGSNDGTATVSTTGGTAPIGFVWSNTQTNSSISNLAVGVYSVTATDATGCTGSATSIVTEPAQLTFALGNDVSVCEGTIVTVDAGPGYSTYVWSSGETTQTITPTVSATYFVTVTNSNGCSASDDVVVTFNPNPLVNLGTDREAFDGDYVTLSAIITNATGSGIYNWQPDTLLSCANCASPTAIALDTIRYILYYTNANGCRGNDTIIINVQTVGEIAFPNAFTPNGDGANDIYLPIGKPVKQIQWMIFNRWGEKVFDSNSQYIGWDGFYKGAPQPLDVYVYYADVVYLNNRTRKFKGSLTLIR